MDKDRRAVPSYSLVHPDHRSGLLPFRVFDRLLEIPLIGLVCCHQAALRHTSDLTW